MIAAHDGGFHNQLAVKLRGHVERPAQFILILGL
jgi:hypothetical protein